VDLIVNTQPVTPSAIAALLAIREEDELICDRCQDPDETLALCGTCTRELPRGYQEV
jgi:hypothetical protein